MCCWRLTVAAAMVVGTALVSPPAVRAADVNAEQRLEFPTTDPMQAPTMPAVDAHLQESSPTAPLPPAIFAGPAALTFAAYLARRIRRRGGRI